MVVSDCKSSLHFYQRKRYLIGQDTERLCERSAADVNGIWTNILVLPSPGARYTSMVTLNEMAYIMGGHTGSTLHAKVWMHDGGTPGAWTNKLAIPGGGRYGHSVLALDNDRALLCGGTNSAGTTVNTCYIYTASTDSWTTTIPSMAHNRYTFGLIMSESMSVTMMNNCIYCRHHLRNRQLHWKW